MNQNLVSLIINVLKDIRVIGTVIAMLLVVEFAKYITSYKKKPAKPKNKKAAKAKPAAAPADSAETSGGNEADVE